MLILGAAEERSRKNISSRRRGRRDADDRTITRPDMQTWLLSVVLGTYNMMVLLARGRRVVWVVREVGEFQSARDGDT